MGKSKIPAKRKKVINYIKDYPDEIAISSIHEIAEKLEVNSATIIRAAKDMGYNGFKELKEDRKNSFKISQNPYDTVMHAMESTKKGDNIVQRSFLKDTEILMGTVAKVDPNSVALVAQLIHKSKRTYIIGIDSGSARMVATLLGNELRTFHPGVLEILHGNEFLMDFIRHCTPKDVIICIGFRRSWNLTVDAVKIAKSNGATIIALVDNNSSPLIKISDYKLITGVSSEFAYSSGVGAISVCNAIINKFVKIRGKEAVSQLKELQTILNKMDVWHPS